MYYLACPKPECRRKVTIDANKTDEYFCAHCNRLYMTCQPMYMFSAKIADHTDSLIVTFARENGVPIMGGLTPSQFRDFKESASVEQFGLTNTNIVTDYLESLCINREYNILLKGKYENFQG